MKHLSILLLFLIFSSNIFAKDSSDKDEIYSDFLRVYQPEKYSHLFLDLYSMKTSFYHIEGKGIGYNTGYSSLELFTMPSIFSCKSLYPFLDLRGHGFNNLKLAGNIGAGVRYLDCNGFVYGVNLYYDYRQGSHKGFGQVGKGFQSAGLGFEVLSPNFDFRLNVYQPVCKRVWHFRQTLFDTSTPIPIPIFIKKRQAVMQGGDCELGLKIGSGTIFNRRIKWWSYLAAGPYYLRSKIDTINWGGKMRFSLYLSQYYLLELRSSYDRITHGTLQFRFGINFPLYPFSSLGSDCESINCFSWIKDMLTQPIERMEIIPLSHSSKKF